MEFYSAVSRQFPHLAQLIVWCTRPFLAVSYDTAPPLVETFIRFVLLPAYMPDTSHTVFEAHMSVATVASRLRWTNKWDAIDHK